MLLRGKILLLTFGLVHIFVGANPYFIFPSAKNAMENYGRSLVINASGILLFGVFMAKKEHRPNIILIYLMAAVVLNVILIAEIIHGWYDILSFYYIYFFVNAIMAALTYKVYNEQTNESPKEEEKNKMCEPMAVEDSKPPPYEVKSLRVQIV
ncbi:uncharacterized protein LOC108095140 [Drosophila ficusphila]|uniref:uncharacterized protein LOC108095140 n=1 Tax=Drosophila ficusphila TaxID=30025 RepID=UPI0007E7A34F|nr:uncharacterized protein LOC108095140 [Drosophila ficusphila]